MSRSRCVVLALAMAAWGCDGGSEPQPTGCAQSTRVSREQSPLLDLPLPSPVPFRQTPEGVALADPAFAALPGASADFGRLGGAVYQIEVPDNWNGRLLLNMHGFEEFSPQAQATAPDFRRYLIGQGFAWGTSSLSSTSLIPGRQADETAALWDYFVGRYGRPRWTYIFGLSMGGWATHISAERYGDRYDGALGLCGAVGVAPGLGISPEFFVAGAYAAGVTQAEFDASANLPELVSQRILPALQDASAHALFENIMIDLTGGPRAFAREGFHLEEETNWRRGTLSVAAGLVPPREAPYELRPSSGVSSDDYNRRALHLPTNTEYLRDFSEGMEVSGSLALPLLTMHTTGDGQVPINQAQVLRQRVSAAGQCGQLVQRVVEDTGHCGFTTSEQEAALAALVDWVEHGEVPQGTDLAVDDLTQLDRTFSLQPRPGTRQADEVTGADERVVVSGLAKLDGATFEARFLGAIVRRNGLVTPCQLTLPSVDVGRYEITVLGDGESTGCGGPGAEIVLWTFVGNQQFFSTTSLAWPSTRAASFDPEFSTSMPRGTARPVMELSGELYMADGRRLPPGTRVEAYVGETLCGIASARRTGSFSGYIISIVGADSLTGCEPGANVTFRLDGQPAIETVALDLGRGTSLDLTTR